MTHIQYTALLLLVIFSVPTLMLCAVIQKGELSAYWFFCPLLLLAVLIIGFFNVQSATARTDQYFALTLGRGQKWIYMHPMERELERSDPRLSFEAARQLCTQEFESVRGQYCAAHPDTFGCAF